jgi:hypothetical protein
MSVEKSHALELWRGWRKAHSWYKKLHLDDVAILSFDEEQLTASQTARPDSMPSQYFAYFYNGRGWHLDFLPKSKPPKLPPVPTRHPVTAPPCNAGSTAKDEEWTSGTTMSEYVERISARHPIRAPPFLSHFWSPHMPDAQDPAKVDAWFAGRGASADERSLIQKYVGSRRYHYNQEEHAALQKIVDREHAAIRTEFFAAYNNVRRELYTSFCQDYLMALGWALDGRNHVGHIILDYLVALSPPP